MACTVRVHATFSYGIVYVLTMSAPKPKSPRRGFTIIELMIGVAIISVLAAIAIPSYRRSVFRARQAEAVVVLGNLKVNQWSYFGTFDCFANTEQHPTGTPGITPLPWTSVATAFMDPCDPLGVRTLASLGLEPSIRRSYFQYQCGARVPMTSGVSHEFTCSAQADLDGDANFQEILFCTDQARSGFGLASPQGMMAACTFPYDVFRVSLGNY